MRIIIFTQSLWSLPSLQKLVQNKQVEGIVIPKKEVPDREVLLNISNNLNMEIYHWDGKEVEGILNWLEKRKADRGLSFGFSYKIPREIFENFQFGVLNVHYGKLPKYAGPSPLFWTVKNGEKFVTITYHQINENWDAGRMVSELDVPVFPGEPIGLLSSRVSTLAANEIIHALENLELDEEWLIEPNHHALPRPKEKDLTIDWKKQTADEIEFLVNASNPHYGGAITNFRENQIRILEVSPAEVNVTGTFTPGTIVYADSNYGIFVLCSDNKYLRINILQLEGTIITGQKLAAFGIKAYEKMN
ncbi:formyltransferase family protein [Algoriphagus sp. SE2]|uniref:methionyl-tRNA formyltransferase n=1 Tax=Algoriphagus sp. SE2 TaxID=3141536 RepID=UPI0031CCF09D